MKNVHIAVTLAILSVTVMAQQNQNQNQHQKVNSNNVVTNSHNITDQATGGSSNAQGGSATGGTSSAQGGSASNGAQQNSQSTSYNDQIQVAPAIAPPAFHTSPCIKAGGAALQSGYGGGGLSWGKVEKGCDIRETAAEYENHGSDIAFCKMMITEPSSKKAKVSFDDCMATRPKLVAQAPLQPVIQESQPPVVVVPPPQVTINLPPAALPPAPLPVVTPPVVKHAVKRKWKCTPVAPEK